MNKAEIFNQINEKLISNLEKGNLIWRKPWKSGLPANFVSRRVYQGINFLLLCFEQVSSPFYLTFLQAQEKNLLIKKGSTGRRIVFYKLHQFDEVNSTGELTSKQFPLLRFSYVFNIEDVEGYETPNPTLTAPINVLNEIIANHSPVITTNFSRCYYSPKENLISVPTVDKFTGEEEYFSSLFHELIHWTGHPSRLNRESDRRVKEQYAYEELVAEIGSSYLLGLCGITNVLDNSSAYLSGWLSAAKGDNSFILSASVQAQKAINFLLNHSVAPADLNEPA